MLGWEELRYLYEEQDRPCRGSFEAARRQQDGIVLASALPLLSSWQKKGGGEGGGSTLWLLTPQFFPSLKHLSQYSSDTSTGTSPPAARKKNVLVYNGFYCAAPSDAGGRNWFTVLSLDHLPAREKHSVSPTRTVTIHDGIIFLRHPFPKYSQCTFSPSNIQSKCTAQEDNSLFREGMERKWGHRVAATAPNTDFLEIYIPGPGVAPSVLCWLWTLYPREHCSSKCGPWTSSIDFTWESCRKAESQTLPQHYWFRICMWTWFPGDSCMF